MYSARKTLEMVFISKVRIKALKYFMLYPHQPIHLRAAVREFNEEINAVRRELERLETVGVLNVEQKGNRKYFQVNANHPFYTPMSALIHKSYGLGGDIVNNINKLGKIELAILTNSFTQGINQGLYKVDLMIVGDIDLDTLGEIVAKNEQRFGRDIHYTVLKPGEFGLRKKRKDNFVMEILLQPKVVLIGKEEDLISGIS